MLVYYNTNSFFLKIVLTYAALTAGLFQFINIKVFRELYFDVSLFHLAP